MKIKVYSLRDVKADMFLPPMYSFNDGAAIRDVYSAIKAGQLNEVSAYPEDFRLYRIGEFDNASGVIKGQDVVVLSEVVTIIQAYRKEVDEKD